MIDVVIRGGLVFDGLGSAARRADVAIADGTVVEIGDVDGRARRTIDATDRYVTPGFVDGHTHLDAQLFWDPYAGSLTDHGVTSAVMGNCGFTLAPGTQDQADLILRSIERAEDMSREAIGRGVPWTWTDFPGYLDAVAALPKALNIAAQIGHSALRAAVLGERAFTDTATADDVDVMSRAVRAAVAAGALGFSTSRSHNHVTIDGDPVASRVAAWDEVAAIVGGMGAGLFQLAPERPTDPAAVADYQRRIRALATSSGRPVTFMVGGEPAQLAAADDIVAAGGVGVGQVHVRGFENVFGFRTTLPFDKLPGWRALRSTSLSVQKARLTDTELRDRLVAEAESGNYGPAVGAEVRAPDFERILVIDGRAAGERSVAEIGRAWGTSPVEVMIELSLATDFEQLFRQPISDTSPELLLGALRHPNTVIAASDSGAHISQILDSNIPTYFLARWVREQQQFGWAEAIGMLTGRPATIWGLERRGVLTVGAHADVVVFDPETVGCALPRVVDDLPDGGPRLAQAATGIDATLVNGVVVTAEGRATGDTPGRLLRGGR